MTAGHSANGHLAAGFNLSEKILEIITYLVIAKTMLSCIWRASEAPFSLS
jgi:hypothetical protein